MKPGDTVTVGPLRVTATDANHSGFRPPLGPTCVPIGFVIAGSYSVYFSGDTDIFADMATLAGQIDVALIPIWGWGRVLGPGHLDPARAAEALTLLQPTLAIPIHWGTFATRGALRRDPSFLVEPPLRFAEDATRVAPEVEVTILQPGDSADLVIPAPRRRRVRP